jgi:phosphatidate cytidylyltransferase
LSSHQQRLITGFGLAFPLFGFIAFGPLWTWAVLVCIVAGVALWEYEGLVFREGQQGWMRGIYYALGVGMPACAHAFSATGLHCCLVLGLFLGLTGVLLCSPNESDKLERLAAISFGWLYIPHLLSYVLLIGHMEYGRTWIFYLLLVTIAGDAGAYYCGRRFGSRKLYERVSPKKTIEGSLGGFACSVMVGGVYGMLLLQGAPLVKMVLLSAALSLVGQLGDLFESMIKRMSGKKDSSEILPGHGGILDRLDSLLFVFPAVWFLAPWTGY